MKGLSEASHAAIFGTGKCEESCCDYWDGEVRMWVFGVVGTRVLWESSLGLPAVVGMC
jgi:hypothetical protein